MDQSKDIERLIAPCVDELGYELVRVQLQGGRKTTLQIMAERRDRRAMMVEDCARISRAISVHLDENDPIASEYTLEVSSPGIDRPLMKIDDYIRFSGHEAKLELETPAQGRKRLQGVIAAAGNGIISVELATETIEVPFDAIRQAKLILTDRLIDAVQNESTASGFAEGADAGRISMSRGFE
jgi:ribosome maturation factor RimP